MNKQLGKEIISKNKIKIIFIIVMFIISGISLFLYSNLDEYIPFKVYEYDISPSDTQYIKNLEIYHNFSKNEGMIIFDFERMGAINKTNGFRVGLPTMATDVIIYRKINETETEYSDWEIKTNPGTTNGMRDNFSIIILGNNVSLNKSSTFIIKYEAKMNPNCRMVLSHNNVRTYGYTPRIYLNLGKKYLCTGECIELKQNMEMKYWSTEREFALEPILNYSDNSYDYHSARLHVINDIRLWQGILLGFIVSSIFLLITFIKELIEENNFNLLIKFIKNIFKENETNLSMPKDLIDKKFELLKLSYDSARTWMLSFLGLMIASLIGHGSLVNSNPTLSKTLFWCMLIFLFGTFVLYWVQNAKYLRLRKYLEEE